MLKRFASTFAPAITWRAHPGAVQAAQPASWASDPLSGWLWPLSLFHGAAAAAANASDPDLSPLVSSSPLQHSQSQQQHLPRPRYAAHLRDAGEHYRLTMDLPGFAKKDVQLALESDAGSRTDTLSVVAARKEPAGSEELRVSRRFLLPTRAGDPKKIRARLADGLLEVLVPKPPAPATPAPIPIPFDA